MENAVLITQQIVIMAILLAIGYTMFKVKLITKDGVKQLTSLSLYLVNPMLVFMSYQQDAKPELLAGLGWSFAASAVAFCIMIPLSILLVRKTGNPNYNIERFSVIYSNCGYIATPLVLGMFGTQGVLYINAFVTFFNILVWTHGLMLMKEQRDFRSLTKAFRSPVIIAVLAGLIFYLLQIRLPDLIAQPLNALGACNTPLGMLIAGATIAQTSLIKALRKWRIYYVCLLKLLVIPLAVLAVIRWFVPDPTVVATLIIACGCPAGAICTLFAVTHDKDALYSSEIFAFTTLLSMVTLPVVTVLAMM